MIEIGAILVGVIILLGLLLFIFISKNSEKAAIIKKAEEIKEKSDIIEKEKEKIKDEQIKKEDNILSGDDVITPGIMPIVKKAKHNHSISEPCTQNCPAYSERK